MTVIASEAAGAGISREYPPRAAVISWIFFDWAAQPYFTLITTFVFAPYFAGFVAGCFAGPHLLSRVGHIRSFAVAAAVTAASILMQPLIAAPVMWFAIRGLAGFLNCCSRT